MMVPLPVLRFALFSCSDAGIAVPRCDHIVGEGREWTVYFAFFIPEVRTVRHGSQKYLWIQNIPSYCRFISLLLRKILYSVFFSRKMGQNY